MRQPTFGHAVGLPVARGPLDAFQRREKPEILGYPSLKQTPLPQKRLMGWLDGDR